MMYTYYRVLLGSTNSESCTRRATTLAERVFARCFSTSTSTRRVKARDRISYLLCIGEAPGQDAADASGQCANPVGASVTPRPLRARACYVPRVFPFPPFPRVAELTRYASRHACSRITNNRRWPDELFGTTA